MKKVLLILIIFLSFNFYKIKAQSYDSLATTGIKQIYNIKLPEAEKTFRALIADYPNHPAGRFFLAMIDWWKILLDPDNESYDDLFFQKIEDVVYQCDELLDKNPNNFDALFFKGGAIGFRGRLRAFRESWLKAADDGREALPIVEKAADIDSTNMDVKLGFGIYDYYASVIPNEYPLLKPLMLFFPEGNKKRGIEELEATASFGKYAKYEARYFLMTLYYNYENNPYKAEEYARELVKDFPDNPIFEKWYGRIKAKEGNYKAASLIFINILQKADSSYKGYNYPNTKREAAYYVGLQYRNESQVDSAEYYFTECADISTKIDKDEPSGFLINSYLYLGMINDLKGDRNKAIKYYNQVLDIKEYGQSHTLAKKYLKEPFR